jgi:hypothetical protein
MVRVSASTPVSVRLVLLQGYGGGVAGSGTGRRDGLARQGHTTGGLVGLLVVANFQSQCLEQLTGELLG